MIDIADKSYAPSITEMSVYTKNGLFDELDTYMIGEYRALRSIEYSGEKMLLGWNVKYGKAGKTLCRVYPRIGHFPMLLVVGQKEKPAVEALLPALSDEFRALYDGTQEGMGQRWLLLDFASRTPLYDDALKIIRIRRQSR